MSEEEKPTPRTGTIKFAAHTQALETAPVIHVDGAIGFLITNGLCKFNLYQDRNTIAESEGRALERVVAARLVMTPDVARSLTKWLTDSLAQVDAIQAQMAATEAPDE